MKKIFILLFLSFPVIIFSQNVGIGTTAPDKLLHIKGDNEVLRIQGSFPWIGFMNHSDVNYRGFVFYPDTSLVLGTTAGTDLPLILAPNNLGLLYATADKRIGIGSPTPTEKLDVNGNINVTGTIKANGADGTAGQVLMKNSSGNLAWGDMSEYKNMATFIAGAGSWTVPAGVTKVWVELWGGGGGGIIYSGGGGGGYISGLLPVTAGEVLSYSVGAGGAGATLSSVTGSSSTLSNGTTISFTANGGQGAIYTPPGSFGITTSAAGGGYTTFGTNAYFGYQGSAGTSVKNRIMQTSATQFFEICEDGNGGDAGNTKGTGAIGNTALLNVNSGTLVRYKTTATGLQPGGGGSGGFSFVSVAGSSGNGNSGGAGMVIIHY